MDFALQLLRVTVAFAALLVWSRIIGKKLISHMTFFDFVAGVTFGAIGGNMMFNHTVSLWVGVVSISVFSLLVLLSDYISLKSATARNLLQGKPKLIIEHGEIQVQAMRRSRLTVNDLLMLLRKKDSFSIEEVETAYFETDGTISLQKKGRLRPVTPEQLGLDPAPDGTPVSCIIDGRIMEKHLSAVGKDTGWLQGMLAERKLRREDILLAQVTPEGQLRIYLK
ncbi:MULTISPECIES: DUF421 domain-containing protein [Paenibacillus]|uniref:DUF421 domain-containing protein n=1 Tax=Paenibacillus TaxID=44249 RepID=UPI0022B8DA80|nr:DUF421 domain-containing protein [Paenibacillus caseinilyticus]MCZ8521071.1 DUF421 domain-containing protein [Paenibacillus caseinilyticus]